MVTKGKVEVDVSALRAGAATLDAIGQSVKCCVPILILRDMDVDRGRDFPSQRAVTMPEGCWRILAAAGLKAENRRTQGAGLVALTAVEQSISGPVRHQCRSGGIYIEGGESRMNLVVVGRKRWPYTLTTPGERYQVLPPGGILPQAEAP